MNANTDEQYVRHLEAEIAEIERDIRNASYTDMYNYDRYVARQRLVLANTRSLLAEASGVAEDSQGGL